MRFALERRTSSSKYDIKLLKYLLFTEHLLKDQNMNISFTSTSNT